MMMTKKNKIVEKTDLLAPEAYAKDRKKIRKN